MIPNMTQVKHEYGIWIVYINGNPKFSFVYREEAEAVAGMIDALVKAEAYLTEYIFDAELEQEVLGTIETALKKAGCV